MSIVFELNVTCVASNASDFELSRRCHPAEYQSFTLTLYIYAIAETNA